MSISMGWEQLGITTGQLRDLWRQKDLGRLGGRFSAHISPHGLIFLKIKP